MWDRPRVHVAWTEAGYARTWEKVTMTESNQTDGSQERLDSLEQRLTALEAENTKLKAALEQHHSSVSVDLTRRQALAGLLGGGTALSAIGTADAQSTNRSASSDNSPWNDDDGDGLLEPDSEFNGIDTSIVKARPIQNPDIGIVPRNLISVDNTTIYVDPSGDDSNDGSEDNPVATIQEAVNRLPLFILHSITIDIAEGEYTSEKESPAIHVGPLILKGEGDINLLSQMMQQPASATTLGNGVTKGHTFESDLKSALVGGNPGKGSVTMAGTESDPSNVYVDVGINWTGFGKLEHMRINGIHWDSLSQFAGQANVRNCVFRGNGAAAISGKNGHVFFKNCDIGDGANDQHAIWGIQLERMYFDFCTLSATDAALNVYNADIYQLSGRNTVNAPETFTMSGGAIATQGTDLYVGGEQK